MADIPLAISDGEGGVYITWRDERNLQSTDGDVYLQRIDAMGKIALGWPESGLAVCALPKTQVPLDLAPDAQGGVLVVWRDFRNTGSSGTTSQDIYAQRVRSNGSIAPGWPENGAPVSRGPDFQESPVVVADGTGGAFFAWQDWRDYQTQGLNIYAQRLTATGEVADGWPENGLLVCSFFSVGPEIVRDVSGGVVVAWTDARRWDGIRPVVTDVYAQRLDANGIRAEGWTENGLLVVPDYGMPLLHEDEQGGFFVGCVQVIEEPVWRSTIQVKLAVQRFTLEGAPAQGWPESGIRVCDAPGNRYGYQMSGDGMGGALFTWYDYRAPQGGSDVYAARILPDGSLAPGWVENGTLLSDPNQGLEFDSDIAPDGTGGAYVVWEWDKGSERPAQLQHLTNTGTPSPGWPALGVRVAPSFDQSCPKLVPDGKGGVIVVWDEISPGRTGIFAQHFSSDEPVAALLSLVSTEATSERVLLIWSGARVSNLQVEVQRRAEAYWEPIGLPVAQGPDLLRYEDRDVQPGTRYAYRLSYVSGGAQQFTDEVWVEVPALTLSLAGFQPNPARGRGVVAFTLPTADPADLEVVDLRGRRVWSREVGSMGPGSHTLQLGTELRPGVYWLRLHSANRILSRRGVILP